MTTVSAPVYGTQVCEHVPAAVCFLCSDQDPRWKSWRIGMGLPEEPPNERMTVPDDEPVCPLPPEPKTCVCTPQRLCAYHHEQFLVRFYER